MIAFQNIYDDIVENYLRINEKSELKIYKDSIKKLRNSYREDICKPLYKSEQIRDSYMLAYFPYYVLLTNEVISKIKRNYLESENITFSIYGCGPAPEVIGICEQFGDKNIKFNLFDYEEEWERQREFIKKYTKNNKFNSKFDEIFACDLMALCKECKLFLSNCKKIIKNTDVFLMQNCLNHITNEEDFLEKIYFIIQNAKINSVFIFIDLSYEISNSLMQKIIDKNYKYCKVVSQNKSCNIKIDKNNINKYVIENIFDGEEGLILKTNIRYNYMIIQKIY